MSWGRYGLRLLNDTNLNGREEERKQNPTPLRLAAMLPPLDHLGRHPGDQASTFDILGHDGSCSDRDSFANRHTWADRHSAPDPTVLSDGDRPAILFAGLIVPRSFVGVCSMRRGVYLDVGRQQRVTTDGDCLQLNLSVQVHRVIVPFLTLGIVQDRRLGTDRSTGSDVNVVALQDRNESTR